MELVEDADRDKNGKIDYEEWEIMGVSGSVATNENVTYRSLVARIKQRIPMAEDHVAKVLCCLSSQWTLPTFS